MYPRNKAGSDTSWVSAAYVINTGLSLFVDRYVTDVFDDTWDF